MKVYLQFPWKIIDSQYYKSLVENPPEAIEYLNTKQEGIITNKKLFWFFNFLKRQIRYWTTKLNLAIPNTYLSPKGNYDLIHAAHCLSKNKDKLWVTDIEGVWQLYVGEKTEKAKEKVRKILLNKNCRKIMPWTETTKEEIIKEFPEVKNKIEVVYPAIPSKNFKKKKNKKITIIYVARYFNLKGGLIALNVLERLRQKYGIKGVIISNVPKNLKKKYSKLEMYDLIPQKELFKLMQKSDIFLYPSFVDTFGFSLLEAMSFGLPIITLNRKNIPNTRKEIVKDKRNGFVIDIEENFNLNEIGENEKKIIKELVEKTSLLINNKKLREKMSKNCIEIIKSGKFSIKERNKKLRRIYEEAIR